MKRMILGNRTKLQESIFDHYFLRKNNKKGQITIFAVIGVILLILFGLLFYFTSSSKSLERGTLLVDDVSEEFSPIQSYVDSCIENIGEKGIKKLGERGGYLYDEDYLSPQSYNLIPDADEPTESNSFYFFPDNKNLAIPYWFYMYYPNDNDIAGFKTEKPRLISEYDSGIERLKNKDKSVEAQIDNYINFKLNDCLGNFESFKQEGLTVDVENMPIATTYLLNDSVQIQVDFPIQVNSSISEDTMKMENFGVIIPVRLKKTFELAEFITKVQIDENFLESNLINLIILNSMVNSELLAPFSDFTFVFGSEGNTWDVIELKKNMQYLLMFTKMLQVQGAKNYKRVELDAIDNSYETRQKVYDNMIMPIVDVYGDELKDSILKDAEIKLNYLDWWPYYFNVNDKGGEVKPELIGAEFGPLAFGMQKYKTLYDVSWPVLVTIDDTKSFNGEGFTFNFGLEGNLRQNKAMNSSKFKNRLIQNYDRSPSVCDNIQRTEEAKIKVTDGQLANLSGVSLTLKTGFETCALGKTNENGTLIAKFPSGILNGLIVASKDGYLDENVQFVQGADGYEIRGMRGMKTLNFKVIKQKVIRKDGRFVITGSSPLEEGDKAIVNLERIDTSGEDGDFTKTFTLEKNNSEYATEFTQGNYNVKINLINMNEEIKVEDSEVNGTKIKGNTFHGMITGGVEFTREENSDFSILFTQNDISSSSEIILYALDFELDWSDPQNFGILSKMRDYSVLNKEELIPELR